MCCQSFSSWSYSSKSIIKFSLASFNLHLNKGHLAQFNIKTAEKAARSFKGGTGKTGLTSNHFEMTLIPACWHRHIHTLVLYIMRTWYESSFVSGESAVCRSAVKSHKDTPQMSSMSVFGSVECIFRCLSHPFFRVHWWNDEIRTLVCWNFELAKLQYAFQSSTACKIYLSWRYSWCIS